MAAIAAVPPRMPGAPRPIRHAVLHMRRPPTRLPNLPEPVAQMTYAGTTHPRYKFNKGDPLDNEDPRPVMRISYTVSDSQMERMQLIEPGFNIQPAPGARPHTHPILAFERRRAEAIGFETLAAMPNHIVVDIGGNPVRHLTSNPPRLNVWSCCPTLSPTDAVRNAQRALVPGAAFCGCAFQTCACLPRVDAYLAVHSLYYLTRADVLSAVSRATSGRLVAITHWFDGPEGAFGGGEAQWARVGVDAVRMEVLGSHVSYSHPALDWARDNYYSDGVSAMAWSVAHTVGDTLVLLFVRAPVGLAPEPRNARILTPALALRDSRYYGAVDIRGALAGLNLYSTEFETQHVATADVYSAGDFIVLFNQGVTQCSVPKGVIATVAAHIAGKPRDSHTLRLCFQRSLGALRERRVSEEQIASLAHVVTAMAFVMHLEDEQRVLTGMLATHGRLFATHSRALSLALPASAARGAIMAAIPIAAAIAACRVNSWDAAALRCGATAIAAVVVANSTRSEATPITRGVLGLASIAAMAVVAFSSSPRTRAVAVATAAVLTGLTMAPPRPWRPAVDPSALPVWTAASFVTALTEPTGPLVYAARVAADILAAPYVEESIREFSPAAGAAIAVAEALHGYQTSTATTAANRLRPSIPAFLLHAALTVVPSFWARVAIHTAFNVAVHAARVVADLRSGVLTVPGWNIAPVPPAAPEWRVARRKKEAKRVDFGSAVNPPEPIRPRDDGEPDGGRAWARALHSRATLSAVVAEDEPPPRPGTRGHKPDKPKSSASAPRPGSRAHRADPAPADGPSEKRPKSAKHVHFEEPKRTALPRRKRRNRHKASPAAELHEPTEQEIEDIVRPYITAARAHEKSRAVLPLPEADPSPPLPRPASLILPITAATVANLNISWAFMYWYIGLYRPLIEEITKRQGGIGYTASIILLEYCDYVAAARALGQSVLLAMFYRLTLLPILHIVGATAPFGLGYAVHVTNNMLAIAAAHCYTNKYNKLGWCFDTVQVIGLFALAGAAITCATSPYYAALVSERLGFMTYIGEQAAYFVGRLIGPKINMDVELLCGGLAVVGFAANLGWAPPRFPPRLSFWRSLPTEPGFDQKIRGDEAEPGLWMLMRAAKRFFYKPTDPPPFIDPFTGVEPGSIFTRLASLATRFWAWAFRRETPPVTPWPLDTVVKLLGQWVPAASTYALETRGPWAVNHSGVIRASVCNYGRPLGPMHESAKYSMFDRAPCEPTFGTLTSGPVLAHISPLVARSCAHNTEIALVNRGLKARLDPEEGAWDPVIATLRLLETDMLSYGPIVPRTFVGWASRFPMAQRVWLVRAYEDNLAGPPPHRWATYSSFIKHEHVLKGYPDCTELFDPRLIQGCSAHYQVTTGPWTDAVAKRLGLVWSLADDSSNLRLDPVHPGRVTQPHALWPVVFGPGHSAEALGQWFSSTISRLGGFRLAGIEVDYRRWDATLSDDPISYEVGKYRRLGAPPSVVAALEAHVDKKGVTPHGKYSISATRASGDGQTTEGNSSINGGVNITACDRALVPRNAYSLMVAGDDMAMIVQAVYARPIMDQMAWQATLGLDPEAHCFSDLNELEFCSGLFWPTTDGVVFGPKPGRVLAKLFHSQTYYTPANAVAWSRAVALGLARDTHHVPVLRVVIARVLDLTRGTKPLRLRPDYHIHATHQHDASVDTLIFAADRYGVSPDEIVALEHWLYTHITQLNCTLAHPLLERMLSVDVPRGDAAKRTAF